ncbi:MAG: DUF6036 family nucleotidyltransferase [Ktedonobacteraceae bacterium]
MDKNEIEGYLKMLGQELADQNRTGEILLVGGAMMILVVGNRHATRDIDASFEREALAIRAAVTQIAYREGLPLDWLNDGAKGFLYTTPPVTLWQSLPGLDIYLPSLEYLLAMKIAAGRLRDIADARALIQHLGITQAQVVLDILQQYIPSKYLTVRVQYIIEDLFA